MAPRARPNREKVSFRNPIQRSLRFWEGLDRLGLNVHEEWFKLYNELTNPVEKMAALFKLMEFSLPKPKPMESGDLTDESPERSSETLELLKAIYRDKIKAECMTSETSQPSQPPSLAQVLPGALSQQESLD
jgi:hypothetical protein